MIQVDWLAPAPDVESQQLPEGCRYFPTFLGAESATGLLQRLWAKLNWQQKAIRMFGREVLQPRLICWQSDPGVRYSYSGLKMEPAAWHPSIAGLRERLEQEHGLDFNSVLLNAYRDGHDSMGWHSDDEPELGPEPVIASISLGAERSFRWREKSSHKAGSLSLTHGSLLLLSGTFQHVYQHAVPKTALITGLRINLTFRQIYRR